jgi:hypothetical protein
MKNKMKYIKPIIALLATGFIFTQASAQDQERPQPPDPLELTEFLFAEFDINEDGAFGPDELTTALTYMQSQRPPRRQAESEDGERRGPSVSDMAMVMYNRHDSNGDGLLQAEEVFNALESRRPPRRISQG